MEYDCLVITPHGIYNIENKDYAGRLEGDDDFWYHKEKEMRNPHKTVRFKTGVLNGKLKPSAGWQQLAAVGISQCERN